MSECLFPPNVKVKEKKQPKGQKPREKIIKDDVVKPPKVDALRTRIEYMKRKRPPKKS